MHIEDLQSSTHAPPERSSFGSEPICLLGTLVLFAQHKGQATTEQLMRVQYGS